MKTAFTCNRPSRSPCPSEPPSPSSLAFPAPTLLDSFPPPLSSPPPSSLPPSFLPDSLRWCGRLQPSSIAEACQWVDDCEAARLRERAHQALYEVRRAHSERLTDCSSPPLASASQSRPRAQARARARAHKDKDSKQHQKKERNTAKKHTTYCNQHRICNLSAPARQKGQETNAPNTGSDRQLPAFEAQAVPGMRYLVLESALLQEVLHAANVLHRRDLPRHVRCQRNRTRFRQNQRQSI
eukprot:3066453-Rhodomonas_salina.1